MQRCGFTPSAIFLVATTSLILSCHDGKSSVPSSANPSGMAQVVGTSFSSTPLVPGGAAPEQFRDEAIQIRFDGPIDPLALGGFHADPGASVPRVFVGLTATGTRTVPYHAFRFQNLAAAALQVIDDASGAFAPGIVGLSIIDPGVLVFDPLIRFDNPFGMAPTRGLDAGRQFDIYIPPDAGFRSNNRPVASHGALPPVTLPGFADPAP
ncbi:MAG: hypothetical protein KDB53_13210, partial [Planctomycetes bacterium]|nr:hypothetical protein [Planctomycetota bacterium]